MKKKFFLIVCALTIMLAVSCQPLSMETPALPDTETPEPSSTEPATIPPLVELVTGNEDRIDVGDTAPDFELLNTEGGTTVLSELRGSPVLLVFWGPSCGLCLEELPVVQRIYDGWSEKGLIVLGVAIVYPTDSAVEQLTANMVNSGYTFPNVLDLKWEINQEYGIPGTPSSFLIDSEGIISERIVGPISEAEIAVQIDELLAE